MSKYDESHELENQDAELPAELAALEDELRLLQPVEPHSLAAEPILAAALEREASRFVETANDPPRPDWRVIVGVAIASSALTATLVLWFRPAEIVERVRIVNVAAPGNFRSDGDVAQDDERPGSSATAEAAIPQTSAPFIAWAPVGSRATELRQVELMLRTDADRAPPGGPGADDGFEASRSPSFLRLQRMLNES